MKRIKLIYTFLLALAFPLLTACSNDDAISEGGEIQKDGKITVHLRVSQAAPAVTRAWKDDNAEDNEMMNVWTVIAVHNDEDGNKNKVAAIYTCNPEGSPDQEVDVIDDVVELPAEGKYYFYSFANMSADKLNELLFDNESIITEATGTNSIVSKITGLENQTLDKEKVKNIAVKVQGNGFDPSANENGFGAKGIPMSNVQELSVTDKSVADLIVIRMLAKIKLQIYNDSGEDITINSVTMTSLTANEDNNLKLLPKLTSGENTMESTNGYHGDIQPNLNGAPSQVKYIYSPEETKKKIDKNENTLASEKPVEYIFYVNESENPNGSNSSDNGFSPTPSTAQEFDRYFLKINLTSGARTSEDRYALIDANAREVDDGEGGTKIIDDWNYIARNDYRIIPIVLDDYKLDMIPYDFPAIGVLPASVKEEDGIYTINFHDYGHFHLVPQVTKYSDGSTVPYIDQKETETTTYWTIGGRNESTASKKLSELTSVWGSWTDASKEKEYKNDALSTYPTDFNSTAFYKTGYSPDIIKDGNDVGGEPVWYQNTNNENPTWSADEETYYGPFIFGYINKHPNGAGDRKVYHEFSIDLHKGNTAPRQMTYRLYMILDEEQMLPATSRGLGASAPRHTHHSH